MAFALTRAMLPARSHMHVMHARSLSFWKRIFGSKEEKAEIRKKDEAYRDGLLAEARRGMIMDMAEFKRNKGKRSLASETLIPKGKAVAFPLAQAVNLNDETVALREVFGKGVTLVTLGQRQVAEPMVKAYHNIFCQAMQGRPAAFWLKINILDQPLMGLLSPLVLRSLRGAAKTEEELQRTLIVKGADAKEIQEKLNIFSALTAFAFLVDERGLLRWQAHGMPTRDEAATLARLATELLEADSESSTKTLRAPHGRPTGQATDRT